MESGPERHRPFHSGSHEHDQRLVGLGLVVRVKLCLYGPSLISRIPAFTTVANLLICVAYWAYERRVPAAWRPPLGKDARVAEGQLGKKINWNTISQMCVECPVQARPSSSQPYFLLDLCGHAYVAYTRCGRITYCSEIFQTSVVGVYSINLADIQTQTRGTSALAAGYNSSLQSVVPIVLIPLTGAFFDRFGMRMFFSASARVHADTPS